MSKERYVTPPEIKKMINNGFYYICYAIDADNYLPAAQKVINAMRKINAKDPQFKYSCECDRNNTIWWFIYQDEEVYKEANNKCNEMILQNRKDRGDTDTNLCSIKTTNTYSPCICPFDVV